MVKVLFIGNSHTYMNDMPEIFRRMMESATGETCEVFMLAYSARSLKWHMEEEYFSEISQRNLKRILFPSQPGPCSQSLFQAEIS